jgi:hypothetical protein
LQNQLNKIAPRGGLKPRRKKRFDMKKMIKKILDMFVFLFGVGGDIFENAVAVGLCDYSGQGRNKYGH